MSKQLRHKPIKGNPKRRRINLTQEGVLPTPKRDHPTPDRDNLTPAEGRTATAKQSGKGSRSKRRKQKPRLKITVQHPEVLEILHKQLGVSKAGVFNLALSRLAEMEGLL